MKHVKPSTSTQSQSKQFFGVNKMSLQVTNQVKTMLSTEIAVLTKKRHDNVMRDIRATVEQLKDTSDLRGGFILTEYKAGNGKNESCYQLDYKATMVVLTGYDVVARAKVVERWQDLEQKQQATQLKTLSPAEMILAQAQLSVELEKRIDVNEIEVKNVAAKVEQISVDLRNGVPHGFISRKNARKIYAKGLSQNIFEEVMEVMQVITQRYLSVGEGFSTMTYAYQEDQIPTAIAHFIRELEQKSPCECFSQVLNKRVRYVKVLNYGLKGGAANGVSNHA